MTTTGNDDRTNNDSKYIIGEPDLDDLITSEYVLTDCDGDSYHGNTMEELIRNYASVYNFTPSSLSECALIKRVFVAVNESAFLARMGECIAESNAKRNAENHAKLMVPWERELAALKASAEDYSLSGFAKKMAELEARKPVLNTKVS